MSFTDVTFNSRSNTHFLAQKNSVCIPLQWYVFHPETITSYVLFLFIVLFLCKPLRDWVAFLKPVVGLLRLPQSSGRALLFHGNWKAPCCQWGLRSSQVSHTLLDIFCSACTLNVKYLTDSLIHAYSIDGRNTVTKLFVFWHQLHLIRCNNC